MNQVGNYFFDMNTVQASSGRPLYSSVYYTNYWNLCGSRTSVVFLQRRERMDFLATAWHWRWKMQTITYAYVRVRYASNGQ